MTCALAGGFVTTKPSCSPLQWWENVDERWETGSRKGSREKSASHETFLQVHAKQNLRAGCLRCAPRNTCSEEAMPMHPQANAGLKKANKSLFSRNSRVCWWVGTYKFLNLTQKPLFTMIYGLFQWFRFPITLKNTALEAVEPRQARAEAWMSRKNNKATSI